MTDSPRPNGAKQISPGQLSGIALGVCIRPPTSRRIDHPAQTGQNKPAQGNPPWVSEASPWESASAPRHRVASTTPPKRGKTNQPRAIRPGFRGIALGVLRPPRSRSRSPPQRGKTNQPRASPGGRHQPPFHRALKGQNNPHVPSHTGLFVVRVQEEPSGAASRCVCQDFRQAFMVRRRSSPSIEPAIGRIAGD